MKGPDWGLAGAGTTVKHAAILAVVFWPSRFRTVRMTIAAPRDLQSWARILIKIKVSPAPLRRSEA